MKTARIIAAAGALFGAFLLPLCADEAAERRLGEEACAQGDYKNAAQYFDNARQISAQDVEKWGANTLSMADAKLRDGDVEAAKRLLAEYRSRLPAHGAGMLPGQILMAEKRYAEAEEFFSALASGASDPETACEAALGVGEARLGQKNFKGAVEKFAQIENENADLPRWAQRALEARIYALIESGDYKTAEELLAAGKFRKMNPAHWRTLDLLVALRRGAFDRFLTDWGSLSGNPGKQPAPILYELAVGGARLAMEKKQTAAAESLWSDAFKLADTDVERQNALRELINLQAGHDPAQAAATLRRYLTFYPDSPDRAGLLLRGARLLAGAGDVKQALDLYSRVTGDNRIPAGDRLTAAREAAVAASDAKLYDLAEPMFRYLVEQAETPAQKEEGELLLGEHYFRCGDFARAAQRMKSVADVNGTHAEAARFWLLRSLIPLGAYAEAMPVAEKLRDAKNPEYRVAAEYYRAFLLEKRGQTGAARSEYERFLILHPESDYVPAAQLAAAELALELRDYPAAAEGLFRYAGLKPVPPDAARALYLAMQAGYFGGRSEDVARALNELDERFPGSAGSVEARLQLADYLLAGGDPAGAEQQLVELEKRGAAEEPEVAAELLYRRAQIARSQQNPSRAKELLETLLSTRAESSFAADAALLAGNLEMDAGRYAGALKFFRQAHELRPDGLFGRIASGRIADARYCIYAETLDPADLKAAAELYGELAEEPGDPRLQLQSLYKLGKCRELLGEPGRALDAYSRVLYLALDQKRGGVMPDPVWTGKAGYSAALAGLKRGTPAGARDALRVIGILEELQLPTGEDFDRIRQEIRRKYNLQRKP